MSQNPGRPPVTNRAATVGLLYPGKSEEIRSYQSM
jgi:hypothetical protein